MDLDVLRHSAAHIMAQAVKAIWPDTKIAIGPAIADGFYYDFDKKTPFLPEDFAAIEAKMGEIIMQDHKFVASGMDKTQARQLFKDEPYKLELINDIPGDEVTIYEDGGFFDLCKGPHTRSTGAVKAFKLLSIAGAYWRGDEKNPMLQRIYGTAFNSKKELDQYLNTLEEAKKRDHRKLGRELELYITDNTAGAGLIIYQPKGAILRSIIEDWEKKEHLIRGYELIVSPHIYKSDLWIRSGHYGFYKDNMYIFDIEGDEYAVKPMNCPGHILVYGSKTRSYRDLPLRFFELGTVYRNEKSGVLHGLLRVRGFTQDDAHIFCLPEQLKAEIKGVLDFVVYALKIFGFPDFTVELSTRPEKSIGTDLDWQQATSALSESLDEKNMPYTINKADGAFYGPKIDIKLKDALNRSWQCATIQCDFALPERFELEYSAHDGSRKRPVMIHRVVLGSMERFIGALIEHYAGAFPLWLSPEQIRIAPITNNQHEYAKTVEANLSAAGFRVKTDCRNETIGYKIRDARANKLPYMLIVGQKEEMASTVAVWSRQNGDEGPVKLEQFIEKIKKETNSRI
ncbi:MAG: threonine--tRNA ligase [Candidatus Omnitrophica bacterium]|jgi:threonyl-tRNA synthetase|nr:threonine--tRNA ligase [Candidatus Omnitrophota bacterium]